MLPDAEDVYPSYIWTEAELDQLKGTHTLLSSPSYPFLPLPSLSIKVTLLLFTPSSLQTYPHSTVLILYSPVLLTNP